MSKEIKEVLYQHLKTSSPKIEDVVSNCLIDEDVKKSFLHYVEWLKANDVSPIYADFEGQSPFWEVEYKGKKHFIVWIDNDIVRVMIQVDFTNEYQNIIHENNLQNIVLDNLQYCSRASGGNCNNCHLPPGVTGVDEVIFGKEMKNLCCGQYITFENPNVETIEVIKKLLEH